MQESGPISFKSEMFDQNSNLSLERGIEFVSGHTGRLKMLHCSLHGRRFIVCTSIEPIDVEANQLMEMLH